MESWNNASITANIDLIRQCSSCLLLGRVTRPAPECLHVQFWPCLCSSVYINQYSINPL